MAKRKPAGELAGDVAEIETRGGEVIIFAPLGDDDGYTPIGVSARLTVQQGQALCRLRNGLNSRDVRLNNGTHIKDQAHVVQYLLEQVAANA